MPQFCMNPNCQGEYAVGLAQCPSCGTPAPPQAGPVNSRRRSPSQIIVSTVAQTLVGAAPGALWYCFVPCTQALVILGLGAFIGFAISLPGFQGDQAARLLAGHFTKNVPPMYREQIVDHLTSKRQAPPDAEVRKALQNLDVPED
jgi:hypothetical protein